MCNLWLRISALLAAWCRGDRIQDRRERCGMRGGRVGRGGAADGNAQYLACDHRFIGHGIDLPDLLRGNCKLRCDARQGIVLLYDVTHHCATLKTGLCARSHRGCERRWDDRNALQKWRGCLQGGGRKIPNAGEECQEHECQCCNSRSHCNSLHCFVLISFHETANGKGERRPIPISVQHRAQNRFHFYDAVCILLALRALLQM